MRGMDVHECCMVNAVRLMAGTVLPPNARIRILILAIGA